MTELPAEVRADPGAWRDAVLAELPELQDLDALVELQNRARALAVYFHAKLGPAREEVQAAAEVELRVKRRLGELLPPPEAGGRGKLSEARTVLPGLDRRRASELRKLAALPFEDLERYLEEQRGKGRAPTAAGALRRPAPPAKPPTPEPAPAARPTPEWLERLAELARDLEADESPAAREVHRCLLRAQAIASCMFAPA